ncbi:MAG TPA: MHYT domain-containing protein, partial [Casimicrobiaceae bacterium]|nr:MHYT domain-containing protein [Casimicrobiaceae bacterium]
MIVDSDLIVRPRAAAINVNVDVVKIAFVFDCVVFLTSLFQLAFSNLDTDPRNVKIRLGTIPCSRSCKGLAMFRVMTCLTSDHDWRLVVLAALVCLLASYAAVSLMHRAIVSRGRAHTAWIVTAGTATGCGIWATHFIAILAYNPGVVVGYGVVLTEMSLVIAIAITSCGFGLAINGRSRFSAPIGGGIVGVGIVCMHFVGMRALELPGYITWSADLVIAAIILAIVFGAGAVTAARLGRRPLWSFAAAILLTLSIVGLHFTAMAAVVVIPDPTRSIDHLVMSPSALALTIAAATVALLGMAIVASFSDRRAKSLVSDRNRLLDAALNNMVQGVNMFDAHARLVLFNERYLHMYRLSPG